MVLEAKYIHSFLPSRSNPVDKTIEHSAFQILTCQIQILTKTVKDKLFDNKIVKCAILYTLKPIFVLQYRLK